MKRWMVWLLVVGMIMSGFVGCGKEEAVANDGGTETSNEAVDEDVEVEALSNKDTNKLEALINKANQHDSYSYISTSMIDMGQPTKVTVHVFKQSEWIRMESEVEGLPKAVVLFNSNEGKIYNIDDAQKTIMIMEDPELFADPMIGLDTMVESGMIAEGTEFIETDYKGEKAFLISLEMDDPESGQRVGSKAWYGEESGLPLAYELNAGSDSPILTEFEYDFSKVDQSLFELPEGYQVIDMGNMEDMIDNMGMDMDETN